MSQVNIVTLAALRPLWLGLVSKDDKSFNISLIPLDSVIGLHKDLLEDSMLIFGDTEESVKAALDNAFPGYRPTKLECRTQS